MNRITFCVLALLACSTSAPAQTTTLLSHTFDAVTAPDLPAGVVAENTSWKTSASSASPGSGLNNLAHTGSAPAFVRMGPIDLSGRTEATLSYYARRTSSYPADSLIVRFSVDGGVTFPHVVSSGGLPAAASAYEYVEIALSAVLLGQSDVYLQFDGRGGSSGSANIRIDDVLVTTPLDLNATDTSFGFSTGSSTWNPDSGSHFVSIDLSWPGPDSIQGFQFDLGFDASLIALSAVSSSHASLAGANWQITESGGRVVVLSLTGETLPPGENTGILTSEWSFVGSPLEQDSTITLGISGLVVAQASPSGDALSLPNGLRSHSLALIANTASITLEPDSLSFGLVLVGDSTSLSVTISNPTGLADLVIDSVRTSSALFRLDSAISPVSPAQNQAATFWFTPTLANYGQITGSAWLYHNASSVSTLISFSGLGVGGRGDTDGDGSLDVADVVTALDAVSGLTLVGASQLAQFDMYPFPAGDGLVDIRDLTVQIQAILRARWPDNSALPVQPAAGAGKGGSSGVFVSNQGGNLYLDSQVTIRGIQIELTTKRQPLSAMASKSGVRSSAHYDSESLTFRSLIVLEPASSLPPGRHLILEGVSDEAVVEVALVVTQDKRKLIASVQNGFSTSTETLEQPIAVRVELFPNPYSLSSGAGVSILMPERGGDARIEVVDMLGRIVLSKRTDTTGKMSISRNQLPMVPGLLFVRVENGTKVETIPLMIVR